MINHQLADDADIIVGVFSQTLGSATPRAVSGTAEELERARDAGKPVHVYFSAMPLDRDHDRDQLAARDDFITRWQARGIPDQGYKFCTRLPRERNSALVPEDLPAYMGCMTPEGSRHRGDTRTIPMLPTRHCSAT